jgi:hypothetical protein
LRLAIGICLNILPFTQKRPKKLLTDTVLEALHR